MELVPFRTSLGTLRNVAVWMSSVCLGFAIVLPLLEYILVWRPAAGRWAAEGYVNWAIVGFLGGLAWLGHSFQNTSIIACHVIFGTTLCAALTAHNNSTYNIFSDGCNLVQIAFTGCDNCPCAADNACAQADLTSLPGCIGCQAWGTDVCSNFKKYRLILALMSVVTLVAISALLVPSLLMLLRLMAARSYATVTLQSAFMLVEEQADLMATGQKPNVPFAELSMAMRQLDTSDQRKYQGSSERCNEQLKLAQERGMSQSVRRGPPLPYNLQAMPSAPSQSGPSMGGTGDWQRLLSHSGPAGIGPASPGGSPVMNPMGGPSWRAGPGPGRPSFQSATSTAFMTPAQSGQFQDAREGEYPDPVKPGKSFTHQ